MTGEVVWGQAEVIDLSQRGTRSCLTDDDKVKPYMLLSSGDLQVCFSEISNVV